MTNLKDLIGQRIYANIFDENENSYQIYCEVLQVNIDSYYFEEKSEPIYITLNLKPLENIKGFYEEDFFDIDLKNIRKFKK